MFALLVLIKKIKMSCGVFIQLSNLKICLFLLLNKLNMSDSENETEEIVEGNPLTVLPIKTRKFVKECTEIVLSKRKINKLVNFEIFSNLEALWLTDNRLTSITGLDANFRIKILCCANNRINTLVGSIQNMKFLETLYLNNNKLKNLEVCLEHLKEFSFLKNLNLCGHPIAEEPEYRPRVVDAIKSLEIFDRHKITIIEKIQAEDIVKEFHDPLSKYRKKENTNGSGNNKQPKTKKLKVYENYSTTEKELFQEARRIIQRDIMLKKEEERIQIEVIEREKYPDGYIPYNNIMSGNMEKYYDHKIAECPELDDNEMDRLFNKYDKDNTGKFKKQDIQLLFFDIKDLLEKRKVEFNENKLINHMLDFYANAGEFITKDDIKKCYGKILHQYKSNMLKEKVKVSDLDYLRKLAGIEESKEGTSKKGKNAIKDEKPQRRDIFQIGFLNRPKREVILNENKLKKMYNNNKE